MTTNREYLYSLSPDELAAWFEAEHDETDAYLRGVIFGRASLDDEFAELVAERDELRERLSRAIGYAHMTLSLIDLEGNQARTPKNEYTIGCD